MQLKAKEVMQRRTVSMGGEMVIVLFLKLSLKDLVRFLVTVNCRPEVDRGMVWCLRHQG
jgi:hypothetical protein